MVNAHIQEILSLPTISGVSKQKMHNFYDSLVGHVQALETFGKLGDVAGNVRMTLDKLERVRADLTRTSAEWKRWTFPGLVEALRQWIEQNPLQQGERDERKDGSPWKDGKKDRQRNNLESVYIVKASSSKHLCFNCTGEKHRASDCRSRVQCCNCKRRHHTSICNKPEENKKLLCHPNRKDVVYPVVVVEIDGMKCRALLNTGSGSSFSSTNC